MHYRNEKIGKAGPFSTKWEGWTPGLQDQNIRSHLSLKIKGQTLDVKIFPFLCSIGAVGPGGSNKTLLYLYVYTRRVGSQDGTSTCIVLLLGLILEYPRPTSWSLARCTHCKANSIA